MADPLKAWLALHAKGEKLIASKLRGFFKQQTARIVDAMGGLTSPNASIVPQVFNEHDERQAMLETLAEPLIGLMATGAERVYANAPSRRTRPKAASKDYDPAAAADSFDYEPFDLPQYVIDAIRQAWRELEQQPYWLEIQKATATKLTELISAGIQEGLNGSDMRKSIQLALAGIGRTRADAIARTETTLAYNSGHEAAYQGLAADGIEFQKKWMAVVDGDTRESHAAANGQAAGADGLFTVGGEQARYPGDSNLSAAERVNCFLPCTIIQGRIQLAMRSRYEGQAVEIVTHSGRTLRVTLNHPVLTENGFIAAGELNRGQKLVCHMDAIEPPGANATPSHDQHKPTSVEQVFQSLAKSNLPKLTRAAAADFYGDGRFLDGEIEIVGATRSLLENVKADYSQHGGDTVFVREDFLATKENCNSPLLSFLKRMLAAGSSRPSLAALANDGGAIQLERLPFQQLRFGSAANVNASRYESRSQASSGDAGFITDLFERFSGYVLLDEIVEIRDFEFCGHVYDFQAPGGWIVANGIYTSNCRCTTVADFGDE